MGLDVEDAVHKLIDHDVDGELETASQNHGYVVANGTACNNLGGDQLETSTRGELYINTTNIHSIYPPHGSFHHYLSIKSVK